jgi:glycosyltransferase involved in cell wall biosynthesis
MDILRKKILKVLFVSSVSTGGGAEVVLRNLRMYSKLENSSFEVATVCKADLRKSSNVLFGKFLDFISFLLLIRRMAASANVAIAGVEGVPYLYLFLGTLGMRRLRTAMWLHCNPFSYLVFQSGKQRILIKLSLFFSKNIICASPVAQSRLNNKNSIFIPNFIDNIPDITKESFSEQIDIIFIGSFSKLKRPCVAVNAFRKISENLNCIGRMHIFGDGPYRNQIENLILSNKLSLRVTLHGFVNNPWSQIQGGSILLLPSLTEAMPMVALEALAYGIPILAHRFSGFEFLASHNGLFIDVDFDNMESIVTRVQSIHNWSTHERLERVTRSKRFLKSNFDNAANLDALIRYLMELTYH